MTLQEQVRDVNTANGWRVAPPHTVAYATSLLALITTEVAEAIEEIRNGNSPDYAYTSEGGKPEGVPSELADIVIRAYDTADIFGINLDDHIKVKLAYNGSRTTRHGGKII